MPAADETLTELRRSIDNIDAALIYLLAERFKITQKVGRYKAEQKLPPADLEPEFAEKFLNFIVKEVIRNHERIRDGG